jgi:hypothetical protein
MDEIRNYRGSTPLASKYLVINQLRIVMLTDVIT